MSNMLRTYVDNTMHWKATRFGKAATVVMKMRMAIGAVMTMMHDDMTTMTTTIVITTKMLSQALQSDGT